MNAMDEREIALDNPALPQEICATILAIAQNGNRIFQVPTGEGVEWWLLDENGEFIEAFWPERRRGWHRGLLKCLFW
jgi:hypothetical protein